MDAFVSEENLPSIFPIFFRGGGGGETLLPPLGGLICYHRWEIAAIITTESSLAWRGAS
jgi:hypothetical protein